MTPRELVRLREAIAFRKAQLARESSAGFIKHQPTPRQKDFLALDCLEGLYGGAAGGGKSDALLMGALEFVHVPGYAALILRRTFRDLNQPDAIMARAKEWLQPTAASWNDRDKRWTFPSGATLTFGYLEHEDDKYQYQGAAVQNCSFDELTQFTESQYTYLISRVRRPEDPANPLSRVPLRVRAGTNPGGRGHKWVKTRFVESSDPACAFVPARLEDNPHIDQGYRKNLERLDSVTRKQLLEGLWIEDTSGLVYRFDAGLNTVPKLPESNRWVWMLGLDFGIVDSCAATVIGWRPNDPCLYVPRSYRFSGRPDQAAEQVRALEREFTFSRIVGDLGGLGKVFGEDLAARFGIPVEAAKKADKLGGIRLLNGDLERGRIKVVPSGCRDLIEEWREVPWAENVQREAEGFVCDASDSALYVYRATHAYHEREPQQPETLLERQTREEAEMVERAEAELERQSDVAWWEQ